MTKWQRFRAWRRSRPFWGGVLTILAGLEIIGSMNLELHGGTISIGQEGFSAYLIAFVLIITGPLAWFMPAQRHFYGLIATFTAVYSLIGVNLGGFFIGMLLGIAGGGLIFAWNPAKPADETDGDESSEVDDVDDGTFVLPGTAVRDGVPEQRQAFDDQEFHPKGHEPRHSAMMLVAVAMSASLLAVIIAQSQAGAASPCGPTGEPPAASAAPSAPESQGPIETIVGGIVDFFDRLLGGGNAGGTATPSASPTPAPTESPQPCPTPTAPGSPDPQPSVSGAPTPRPAPTPTSKPVKVLDAPGQLIVGERPSRMTGSVSTMWNLDFRGVVDLPTHDGEPIRSLWFTMSKSETDDFLLHVYGKNGWDMELPSSKLTVKGDTVHFYTSRFRGNLLGVIPVDYRPEPGHLPPGIPIPIPVFFTNVNVELVWVSSPVLQAPDLRTRLVPA